MLRIGAEPSGRGSAHRDDVDVLVAPVVVPLVGQAEAVRRLERLDERGLVAHDDDRAGPVTEHAPNRFDRGGRRVVEVQVDAEASVEAVRAWCSPVAEQALIFLVSFRGRIGFPGVIAGTAHARDPTQISDRIVGSVIINEPEADHRGTLPESPQSCPPRAFHHDWPNSPAPPWFYNAPQDS